jgi:hypothetical protein
MLTFITESVDILSILKPGANIKTPKKTTWHMLESAKNIENVRELFPMP